MSQKPSIAIVGIGGIFPDAPNADDFWANVLSGKSSAREVSPERWTLSVGDVFDPEKGVEDKVFSKRGCYIDDIPEPPVDRLRVDAQVLKELDPSVRLLLSAGVQAVDDGNLESVDPNRVGIVLGNLALPTENASSLSRDFLGRNLEEKVLSATRPGHTSATHPLNRYVTGLPAGALAKAFGFGGGAMTLDAACSSSLYALKLAVDELQAGRADAMLTGGLSRPDCLYAQMGFSQLRALSPTGTCSPFDAKGDGLVVGEGAGVLALKRVDDAVRDGDHIYAVIRGVGLSNDVGGSLLAPMSEGQLRAMRAAYEEAGWSPHDVDMVECHATGTPVGDGTEVASLKALWGGSGWTPGQCVIGSVKSNIGHLLTAAGSAAIIKTVLAMREEKLPPTANFHSEAPGMDMGQSPFTVLNEPRDWTRRDDGGTRKAAVSAFGFGGINAHVLLEEWRDDSPAATADSIDVDTSDENRPAIAVVGMEACFGPWRNLRAYQERVLGGGMDVEPGKPRHWWGTSDSGWFKQQGLSHTPFAGYYLDDIAFPLNEFRIPPIELEEMLPQQLLMLHVAAGALADCGIRAGEENGSNGKIAESRAGVFVGLGLDLNTTNYHFRWSLLNKAREWARTLGLDLSDDELADWTQSLRDASGPPLTANRTMGGLGSIVASRIAREYRFGGPSYAVSSEESSSMQALHIALRALQDGSLDMALVGGVDLAGDVRSVLNTHLGRPFSASGVCRPFDERADGTLVGDGAAAFVLKRLDDAEKSGDRIYAVIKGMGIASGGGVENQVPTEEAYVRSVQRAARDAGVSLDNIDYVETHGSGCPEEDAMEARALARLYKPTSDEQRCIVSSVKGDIGHSGAASGLASLAKACLSVYQEILPPLRHVGQLRTELTTNHRLHTSRHAQYWLRNQADGPLRAGVSSFSVDGNCAHVIVESYEHAHEPIIMSERLQPLGLRSEGLFLVEANNVQALEVGLGRLRAHVEHRLEHPVEVLAREWWDKNRSDSSKKFCISFVARNASELLEQLEFGASFLDDDHERRLNSRGGGIVPPYIRDRVFYSPEPLGADGTVAFVYPGSGNQSLGMGRDMSTQWPELFRKQDQENEFLRSQFQPDVFWNNDSIEAVQKSPKAALFGQVALGTVASDLIQSFGVRPNMAVGYSLGEMTSFFSLKAWTDRDEMLRRINESTLFTEDLAGEYKAARKAWKVPSNNTVDWALGVIDRPAKVVRAAVTDHKKVYNLIVNTLQECVVGGDPHAVEKLVKKLDCEFFPLHGVSTVHCEVAQEVQEPYRELHVLPTTAPRDVKFYSGASGTAYNLSSESAADSVLAQALYGIDYPKVVEAAYEDGARLFLEMGPGSSCSRMIGEILGDRPHVARSISVPGHDAVSTVLRMLGQLAAERVPVDLSALYGQEIAVSAYHDRDAERDTLRVPVGGDAFEIVLPGRTPSQPEDEFAEPIAEEIPAEPAPAVRSPQPVYHEPVSTPAAVAVSAEPFPEMAIAGSADPALHAWSDLLHTKAEAHELFLRVSQQNTEALSQALAFQMDLLQRMSQGGGEVAQDLANVAPVSLPAADSLFVPQVPTPIPPADARPAMPDAPVAMDRAACMEFARGSIAASMGAEWGDIDTHPTRVRLPDEPLMLVDRILSFHGEARSMGSGRVVTEHDVLPGAWYLDGGRIPTSICVESGQADLILSAYLGIDFETQGLAMYRLLDAVVTFHRGLPVPGETIHFDIRIENFFRQGDTYLFRFNYDATVNGEPLLTMRNGCAGFFTREELDAGVGIVKTELDLRPMPGVKPADWRDLTPMELESYSDAQVTALRKGDLPGCFGPLFDGLGIKNPIRIPDGRMNLVDRIIELDPTGGRFGMGVIRGEMDVHPDDWFLTCHFVDDQVMPGTLMYECCLHTMRIYLMRMGWVGEADDVVYEPVPGVSSQLKCRGEVNESTDKVIYEITIKELGYNPHPYAIADTLMYVDGKPAVEMNNMAIQMTGWTRENLEHMWAAKMPGASGAPEPLFDYESILAFSSGKPSEAFGDRYAIFDEERVIARLPRPPFQFLDRIVDIRAEQWVMKSGGEIVAEYDVPSDEWYFASNRQPYMPFSVLLEIALQPCGWLAAYMGSALTSEVDLHFRNLGGNAVQLAQVTPDMGTLSTWVKSTGVSSSGGMIIQNYEFEMRCGGAVVYKGDTYFGYFSEEALADQVGIRDAALYEPTPGELSEAVTCPYPAEAPYPDDTMRMVKDIEVYLPQGGKHGLGFIRGGIDVNPDAWFFQAHFYQDPVWPGSLGLEGFLQLLRHASIERWAVGPEPIVETLATGTKHSWVYRGQVIPKDSRVTIEATIKSIDDEQQIMVADGFLSVDGRDIYQMTDFAVRLVEPGK